MNDWLRVFEHELSRRRRIYAENPDTYIRIHAINPKGLLHQDTCNKHVWVPATHLMIHDNGAKSYTLGGIRRRSFSEASVYIERGYQLVPQICWRCDATRILELDKTTAEQRLATFKSKRPRKLRGRKPTATVFNELF